MVRRMAPWMGVRSKDAGGFTAKTVPTTKPRSVKKFAKTKNITKKGSKA
jgi:hypothetical protein